MLSDLEGKVTAVVGDALADRPQLSVVRAVGPAAVPSAGTGIVRVGLSELTPEPGFEPEHAAFSGSGGAVTRRRVLPVRFTATIEFARAPATDDDTGRAAGRSLLLEDISATGYALGNPDVRSGGAFAMTGADPGFAVHSFDFGTGATDVDPPDGTMSGRLEYIGRAEVWPATAPDAEGVIQSVDVVTEVLPVTVTVDDPAVPRGGTTTVRIRTALGTRLSDPATGAREAVRLAVTVASDLPPAERGTIVTGDPGAETGTQIVTGTDPETAVVYAAPTGDPGAVRVEHMEVRLAAPDGRAGVLLASVAILLAPGGP
jgi:hypothetical protein